MSKLIGWVIIVAIIAGLYAFKISISTFLISIVAIMLILIAAYLITCK